ncbi:hypothetical protein Q3G72_011087 [Acer saccharum]|nr:hypothetical protein Q3G72_011087 [Acer saccharum]
MSRRSFNSLFRVDAKSRSAYKYFGDVVVFDSAYNTNRYGMIFAPFIGVNNHGQTIILACSLLSDNSDSFVWLLEQFKKNMPSGLPKMIITDQDLAMTNAISQALLDTFHRAIARQRCEELTADHVDINEKPVLKMPNLIEKQMAETYTHKILFTFQQELWNIFFYDIELVRENGDHFVYTVKRQDENSCRIREIVFKKELDFTSCSCKKFESEGIPCRHIFAYLNHMHVRSLPNQYIMKRWTQTVKCNKVIDEDGLEINDFSDKSFMVRHMRLIQLATYVIDKATCIEDASKILEDILNNAILDIKSTLRFGGSYGVSERNNVVQHVYNEPLVVRAKSCGKKLKGGKEKAINKAIDVPINKIRMLLKKLLPCKDPWYEWLFHVCHPTLRVKLIKTTSRNYNIPNTS